MRRKAWFWARWSLVLAAVAVAAGLVMMLWNTVATTALAGAHSLDYVHALGLLVLCRILFGGFRGRGPGGGARNGKKWQAMTPEERAALSQRWGSVRALAGTQ